VSVTDTTRNLGSGTSPATTTHYYLSPNNSYSSGDILLGSRTVGTLAGGASSTGGATLTIPAGTAPGSYYIIAYADGGSAVNELKETNNTRSSKFSVR
jgi:subtilase family serine protease